MSFQNLLLLNASIPKMDKDKKEDKPKTFDFNDLIRQAEAKKTT